MDGRGKPGFPPPTADPDPPASRWGDPGPGAPAGGPGDERDGRAGRETAPHGGPPGSSAAEEEDRWLRDYRATLGEIDAALGELRSWSVEPPATVPRPAPKRADRAPRERATAATAPRAEIAGGYLDERIAMARALAANVRGEVAALGRRLDELEAESRRLDRQLELALQELVFVRREPWALRRPGNAMLADDPDDPDAEVASDRRALAADGSIRVRPPRYTAYTERRYRTTMDGMHAHRGTLLIVTVAASVAVGLALLFLTLRYPIAASSPWIGPLPLIWLIPVPFFLTAALGTHRVLGRRSLLLPEPT